MEQTVIVEHCGDASITGSILNYYGESVFANDDSWKDNDVKVIINNVVSNKTDFNKDIRAAKTVVRGKLIIQFEATAFDNQVIRE